MRFPRSAFTSRVAALAAVAALTLAACGGSDAQSTDGAISAGDATSTDDASDAPGDAAGEPANSDSDSGGTDGDDSGAIDDASAPLLEPAVSIPVDVEPGNSLLLAVSPDGTHVAALSAANEAAPARTLTTYSIDTGEIVATVDAVPAGTLGSGPTWLPDGRIAMRKGDTIAAWNGPELTPIDDIAFDSFECDYGAFIDPNAGATYRWNEYADPTGEICRLDLTTGEVTVAAVGDLDRWFYRSSTNEIGVLRDAGGASSLVTLDGTTLAEKSSQTLDIFSFTPAGLLVGEGANTMLIPGDIPIPTGRLSGGAELTPGGRYIIDSDGSEQLLISTADGSVVGQVEPDFNKFMDGWTSDDTTWARPIGDGNRNVVAIDIHRLG